MELGAPQVKGASRHSTGLWGHCYICFLPLPSMSSILSPDTRRGCLAPMPALPLMVWNEIGSLGSCICVHVYGCVCSLVCRGGAMCMRVCARMQN